MGQISEEDPIDTLDCVTAIMAGIKDGIKMYRFRIIRP